MNEYPVGNVITITGTFTDQGTPADPVAVRAHFIDPSGEQTDMEYGGTAPADAELTKASTGVYAFDMLLDQYGKWYYRIDDNSENIAVEGELQANHSKFDNL